MANQHPRFGLPAWNRRDNSYGKREWRSKKIRENFLHARVHPPDSYRGWFQMAGFYRDTYKHNGLMKFYSYNKSDVRRSCNRKTRHSCKDLESRPNPAWYRKTINYVDEVI